MLDSFILFHEYKKYFEALPPDKCKELLLALFYFSEHGEPPSFSDISVELASFAIIDSIKRTKDKYAQTVEKNRENGAKGGRPKKNPPDSQDNPNNPPDISETQPNPSEANESICNSNCISGYKESKTPSCQQASLLTGPSPDERNEIMKEAYHSKTTLPRCRIITDKMKKDMLAVWKAAYKRLQEKGNAKPTNDDMREHFEIFFTIVSEDPFKNGKNNRGWKANFAWLMRVEKWAEVINSLD